jgi:hypothetical protein
MQRIPPESRWEIAAGLAGRAEDADDHNLQLMIWYGVEPLAAADAVQAAKLASRAKLPLVRRFLARRIASQ